MAEQSYNVHGPVTGGAVVFGNGNVVQGTLAQPGPAGPMRGPVIGIVTALPEEFAAVRTLLDDERGPDTKDGDPALYLLATLPSRDGDRPHEVVLTLLGDTGNAAAAEACARLTTSFPTVDIVIMCGTACGVPNLGQPERHVRLGDIVVATWGIADYDHVVERDDGRWPRQPFPRPSPLLVRLARYLAAVEISGERPWEKWITAAVEVLPAYARPASDQMSAEDSCASPDLTGHRPMPTVHHGLIGSADRSLRSAAVRDALAEAEGLIAFEMEGKGIGSAAFAGGLEWFVVRGISDHGDAQTSLRWRGHASVVAAAYVKALLGECPPLSVRGGHTQATGGSGGD
jgi:nucleoside phosphorylase